jgi:hypothetical protein
MLCNSLSCSKPSERTLKDCETRMTVLSPSLLTSAGSARVSLDATLPMAEEREEKRKYEVSYFDEIRAGGGEPFLKSVPVHAIDLRQIELSYNVRLRWVYIQRFLKGTGNGGSTESKKSRASIPKRSREELLASPARDFDRSTQIQIEARAAAETDIEEEYLSSVKRRKLLRTFIANSNVIHETKSHPVISLLISPYHTSPCFGGRFPDSRKPSGNAWHSREV